jgi:hypothetical protein
MFNVCVRLFQLFSSAAHVIKLLLHTAHLVLGYSSSNALYHRSILPSHAGAGVCQYNTYEDCNEEIDYTSTDNSYNHAAATCLVCYTAWNGLQICALLIAMVSELQVFRKGNCQKDLNLQINNGKAKGKKHIKCDTQTHNDHTRISKNVPISSPDFLLINCRSVKNKSLALEATIQAHRPDCVILTETWLDKDVPDNVFCPVDYVAYRKDRNTHGGGIAILVKSDIKVSSTLSTFPLLDAKTDILLVSMSELNLNLIAVYHPFWKDNIAHDKLLSSLNSLVSTAPLLDSRCVIAGDLNEFVSQLDDFTLPNNLTQLVNFPTMFGNSLDVFLTNLPDLWQTPHPLAPLATSDHAMVLLKGKRTVIPRVWFVCQRIISRRNSMLLGSMLSTQDWSFLANIVDANDCCRAFYIVLHKLMDICIPMKRIKMKSNDKWWINPTIKHLMNLKDKAYKKKRFGDVLVIQHQLDNAIKVAMKNHLSRKLDKCETSKDKWRVLKSIAGSQTNIPNLTSDMAHAINSKFCSVFGKEDVQEFDLSSYSLNCRNDAPTLEEFEIFDSLQRIKSYAMGPDDVPGHVYKFHAEFLAGPLAIIFNKSLQQCCIPAVWKSANVVPIPKSKDEFRPISLLCHPIKILEKLVLKKWLVPALQRPFCSSQFAFVPNIKYGGCCNALTLARVWSLRALDEGAVYVRWLAVDFKKAFDTVSHKKVLTTLADHFHVTSGVIPWLFDYFSGRVQRVYINTQQNSPFLQCSSGVPQGSILGPVLFAILLDPCLSVCQSSKVISYADDCTILSKVLPNLPDSLQSDADLLIQSAASHRLEINPMKCHLIQFIPKRHSSIIPPDIILQGALVKAEESVKILGIWFSSNLKWSVHLDHVFRKCAKASYFIKLLFTRGISGHLLRSASESLVLSHLVYCWPVLCDCTNADLRRFNHLMQRLHKLCRIPITSADLRNHLDQQCVRLARRIKNSKEHPLEECFMRSESTFSMVLRNKKTFLPLPATKAGLRRSFTKFAC